MAAACASAGVAVISGPEPGSIATAIAAVLDDERFRDRARAIAEQIRAMPAPSKVMPTLQEVASHV